MSLISFVYHRKFFYFIIYWVLEISVALIKNGCNDKCKDLKLESNLLNEYINLICLNVADLLAGFLVIYTIYSISQKKTKKDHSEVEIELIYNDPIDSINKKNKRRLLILISIIDLISRSVYFLFFLIIQNEPIFDRFQMDWIIAIDILNRYYFSRIILKTKSYKHHVNHRFSNNN